MGLRFKNINLSYCVKAPKVIKSKDVVDGSNFVHGKQTHPLLKF